MRLFNMAVIGFILAVFYNPCSAQTDVNDFTGSFGFDEMEIIKLDWDIKDLRIADFNGDKKNDIAIVNNGKSKIELLIQQDEFITPEADITINDEDIDINLKDAPSRFKKQAIAVSQNIFSFVCGDLNSDGMTDLAFYGEPKGLYIILQKKNQPDSKTEMLAWQTRKKIDIDDGMTNSNGLVCADLNNDKKADLALAGNNCVYIITQKDDGSLAEPIKYPTTNRIIGIDAADLNGDGINDLIYITDNSEKLLSVRFGKKNGQLGPQIDFFIERPWALKMHSIDQSNQQEILSIEAKSSRLACYKLLNHDDQNADENWPIYFYPLVSGQQSSKRDLMIADFDGDKLADIVISEPGAAELVFYKQINHLGLAEPVKFPALADITSLSVADINGDKKSDLAILSVKEKTIGLTSFQDNRFAFPKPIGITGEPLAMDLSDMDNDKKIDCLYISKDTNDVRYLNVIYDLCKFTQAKNKKSKSNQEAKGSLKLKSLTANPDGIKIIDVDQDGLKDILIFVKYEQPLLVRQTKPKVFQFFDPAGTQAGLIKDASMQSVTIADVDQNKANELLLAQKNFARSLKMSPELSWQIIDQYNAKSTENDIFAAAALNITENDIRPAILLLDGQKGLLQILKYQPDKTYRFDKELQVGKWNQAQNLKILMAPLTGSGANNILIFDSEKFALITPPDKTLQPGTLEKQFSYETKIKDGLYGNLAIGDINNDGKSDIVMVEYNHNHIEILALNDKAKPVPAMRFKLFEKKGYQETENGKSGVEPRELSIADVTGDSKNDLVTVIHDRIIIYPQD